jgi:hypothetical protein
MRNLFRPTQTTIVLLTALLTTLFSSIIPSTPVQANPLDTFLNFLKRNPKTIPGRRPSTLFATCELIPPGADAKPLKIWNRQPSFFSLSVTGYMTLIDAKTNVIVAENPTVDIQKNTINLRDFKPGVYRLSLSKNKAVRSSFTPIEIMTDLESQKVTQQLTSLDLKGLDPETIALKRSEYLIDQDLIIDAIETLFKFENPSSNLITYQNQFIETLCPTNPKN